jgi:quercetin dioxygenase-like cupin family protein
MTDLTPRTVVDLLGSKGVGSLWGTASTDLNATLLAWPPGHYVAEHINAELEVLVIVLDGSGAATVDQRDLTLTPGSALLIEKGSTRTIRAGRRGRGER